MYFKTFFKFTKTQQKGLFLLLFLIITLQCVYVFVDLSPEAVISNSLDLETFQEEVDSLKLVGIADRKPKVYPFNPNYITDYKGYTLGMSLEEIDRLQAYRKRNKWVNSAKEFQKVTGVSDTLLKRISPNFKFPEWVRNPKPQRTYTNYNGILIYDQKKDLNTATKEQLQTVNGIGKKLSERIVRFRNTFVGGFIADIQLQDVYGLRSEVIERVTQKFTVKTPRQVQKHNLNAVSLEALVTIQHIDYDLAFEILDQRTLRDGFSSLSELTKVKGFPVDKIEIIKLYLKLD